MAQQFRGVSLSGVSSAIERGYATGMAIFLAYSGMEALAIAMGQDPCTWILEDKKSAHSLYKLLKGVDLNHLDLTEGIGWLLDNYKLIKKLKSFQAGETYDVLLIARSLRHMVAHGSFTTHGLKMFTKRECNAVEHLRQQVFHAYYKRLDHWLDQRINKANNTSLNSSL
jgi:hypothetical protein